MSNPYRSFAIPRLPPRGYPASEESLMSLPIEVENVIGVLLKDGWHDVVDQSFEIDTYKYLRDGVPEIESGQADEMPSIGATWKERGGSWVACAFPAIVAVKYK
jgi:hypothetical protein